MFLKSTHIQHYKSLDDVRVDFSHPITVIVGRNAAGKTNLVDALCFASETVQEVASRKTRSILKRGASKEFGRRAYLPQRLTRSRFIWNFWNVLKSSGPPQRTSKWK